MIKDNIGSSELLKELFQYSTECDKSTFKVDTFYDTQYMKSLMMYTTYNQNFDSMADISYDARYPNYIRDVDEFNNNIFFEFNLKEIEEFREFISPFNMDILEFKLDTIIEKTHMVIHIFEEDSEKECIDIKLKLRRYLN